MIFCGAATNGGKAAVPQIIDHTAFHEGVRTSLYIKHSTDQLLNESTADTLKSMMKSDVENNYGSGNFPGLDIGAKSGTSGSRQIKSFLTPGSPAFSMMKITRCLSSSWSKAAVRAPLPPAESQIPYCRKR